MSTPGVDHPRRDTEVEVTSLDRDMSVSARTETTAPSVVVVRPSAGVFVDHVFVRVGERVSVFWRGPEGGRALPAVVTTVERGAAPRWHLSVSGPAEDSQRRTAVRARVTLPVTATLGSRQATGQTLDLSESGIRAALDGWGRAPETGTRLQVSLELEDGVLSAPAEVARQYSRGTQWVVSILFTDLPEKEQDRVRRRVFRALREERARLFD